MVSSAKSLSGGDIRRLLEKLDLELANRGQRAALYVVGGANIALALDESRSTTDVDSVVTRGFDVVFDAARAVAREEDGVGEDWLNADFTGGTPDGGLVWPWLDNRDNDVPITAFDGAALRVQLASPPMMLALKTLAQRPQDMADIYQLMRLTGIRTAADLGRNLARFTGPRIFQAQGQWGTLVHIDPAFRNIMDNAPPDLRPPDRLPASIPRWRRWFRRNN